MTRTFASDFKIMTGIKVDTNAKIVTEMNGGKHGARHRIENFVPQKTAANTRRATVVTQTRRQYGKDLLLRRIRHFTALAREIAAANAKRIFTTETLPPSGRLRTGHREKIRAIHNTKSPRHEVKPV